MNSQFIVQVAEHDINETELNFVFDQIIRKMDFPLVITDPEGEPTAWKGISIDPMDKSPENLEEIRKIVRKMDSESEPIPMRIEDIVNYIHYGDSNLIRSLQWLPYVEVVAIGLFIFIGFIGCQRHARHPRTILQLLDFRVLAQIADQCHAIFNSVHDCFDFKTSEHRRQT